MMFGPMPVASCVWCQADLSSEPHQWWCRPEQYRITQPPFATLRRDQGRRKRWRSTSARSAASR